MASKLFKSVLARRYVSPPKIPSLTHFTKFKTTVPSSLKDYEIEYSPIDTNFIYSERTGVTATLWNLRHNLVKDQLSTDHHNPPTRAEIFEKPPWQSEIVLCYNFGSEPVQRQEYLRFDGGVRFDKILEDMDALAGNVCQLHADSGDNYPINFVTAAVDRIDLLRRFPMTKDLVMNGRVIYVGSSSLTVSIDIYTKEDVHRPICNSSFVMVALDPFNDFKPLKINKLKLETDEDKHLHVKGEYDAQQRRESRKKSLTTTKPTSEESGIIHDFFLQKRNGDIVFNNSSEFRTMISTRIEHTTIMQPQELNRAGKIFGGYLMKSAFELARSCAYLFTGFEFHPIFAASDEINFEYPVSIGSLVKHEAFVTCTDSSSRKKHSMCVIVRTTIKEPANEDRSQIVEKISNLFSFTFILPQKKLPRIIPNTYGESMLYLYGRRCLQQSREISIREGSLLAQYI